MPCAAGRRGSCGHPAAAARRDPVADGQRPQAPSGRDPHTRAKNEKNVGRTVTVVEGVKGVEATPRRRRRHRRGRGRRRRRRRRCRRRRPDWRHGGATLVGGFGRPGYTGRRALDGRHGRRRVAHGRAAAGRAARRARRGQRRRRRRRSRSSSAVGRPRVPTPPVNTLIERTLGFSAIHWLEARVSANCHLMQSWHGHNRLSAGVSRFV